MKKNLQKREMQQQRGILQIREHRKRYLKIQVFLYKPEEWGGKRRLDMFLKAVVKRGKKKKNQSGTHAGR